MRVVLVGTSGCGKTTLGRRIAARLGIPFIELDAVNFQPGWHDLAGHDVEEFKRRALAAIAPESWICDGNYNVLRPLIWKRVSHLVWLDYDRPIIMRRVLWRSLLRALDKDELWPGTGNRERFGDWIQPYHPLRWAWSTFASRRQELEYALQQAQFAHIKVLRLRHPREADGVLTWLRQ